VWLVGWRGARVGLVEMVEFLQCGVEVLVRLRVQERRATRGLANNTINSPNTASIRGSTNTNIVNMSNSRVLSSYCLQSRCTYAVTDGR
jgi:hypothetical protein